MDVSKLKPFDGKTVKAGTKLVWVGYSGVPIEREYVAGPDLEGLVVCKGMQGNYKMHIVRELCMVPLCVVEGTPVYPGDTLYIAEDGANCASVKRGDAFAVECAAGDPGYFTGTSNGKQWYIHTDNLTPVKPKVKKTAWMNVYNTIHMGSTVHPTKTAADSHAGAARIKCVEISWEE